MANDPKNPGPANPAQAAMTKAADIAAANARAATSAATDVTRTAAGAATDMTRTAASAASAMSATTKEAAASMSRTAMDGMGGMAEFSRMFADMKMPAMPDMEAFLSVQRRNMEVLSAANRVALEGAQTVARRHMEIVQQTMSDMTDSMRQMSNPDSPQARAAKQAEMVKQGYERAVTHMRELADLIQQSNGEALGLLNKRFAEAMDEVKQLAAKSGQQPHR